MKVELIFIFICLIGVNMVSVLAINSNRPDESDLKSAVGNHSLFSNKNGVNLSSSYSGVPPPLNTNQEEDTSNYEPESIVAKRLVEMYRKQFDYLDAIVVDNILQPEELKVAFEQFGWPKRCNSDADLLEYSRQQIELFDANKKVGLSFPEFCAFAESLWEIGDEIEEEKCLKNYNKALDIFKKLFRWLDRDNRGYISDKEMIYGISMMMYRDVDLNEIEEVLKKYGGVNRQLNYDNFVLAVVNGMLDKTFSDPNFTETLE